MRPGRRVLARVALIALLASCLVAVSPGLAQAQLSERRCYDFLTGDRLRRLSVCIRGWVDKLPATSTRGVVEMHTYAWGPRNDWVDSRSRSITLNDALLNDGPVSTRFYYGQDLQYKCRVNGPGGRVACSVPNAVRVAFYSPHATVQHHGDDHFWRNLVNRVTWRDDRGVAHKVEAPQDTPTLESPYWDTIPP